MIKFYKIASQFPRWLYLATALSLYVLMLAMGAMEPAVDALPGRADYSKLYHIVFYFGLSSLLWFGANRPAVIRITALVAAAGAIDEFHQYILPFRYARLSDVLIDTVAALAAALILQYLQQQSRCAGAAPVGERFHPGEKIKR